jgi:transposase
VVKEEAYRRVVKVTPEHGETTASLLQKRLTAPHPRLRERLLALALIMAGRPAKHVARQLGRSRGTVEDWVRRFNTYGTAGLSPTFRGQPGTQLTPTERAQLQAIVQRPPRAVGLKTGTWTGKGVAAFVKHAFGKTISAATARRYLHRLGFRRKRPRKRVIRAKPAAQRAFAQALQQMAQPREPGRVTVSMDQGQMWPDVLPRLGGASAASRRRSTRPPRLKRPKCCSPWRSSVRWGASSPGSVPGSLRR